MYEYRATWLRIIDGDTIVARVDLGFYISVEKTIRVNGVDCPECRTRDLAEKRKGMEAKGRVAELMEENGFEFRLISHGIGKYGRVVGDVIFPQGDLSELLIAEGHGKRIVD